MCVPGDKKHCGDCICPGCRTFINTTQDALKNERDALKQRVADLKFALGDDAGWFDRAVNAEGERDALKAELGVILALADDYAKRGLNCGVGYLKIGEIARGALVERTEK